MYQNFVSTASPEQGPPRLAKLREIMKAESLDGWIVPRGDTWRGENVRARDERLAWLTGFTGSAGFAAILDHKAGVFIDGRYKIQIKSEVASDFTPVDWPGTKLADWLIAELPEGGTVGYDAWLHTPEEIRELKEKLQPKGIGLKPCDNLVDAIWEDRPAPPPAPFIVWPETYAGRTHAEKRAEIAALLREAGQRCAVLTLPDSIAWLLNIRGDDVPSTPVPLSFAIIDDTGRCELFCPKGKADDLRDHLGADVDLLEIDAFLGALGQLSGPVRIDPKSAPSIVETTLRDWDIRIAEAEDPCILPKARKNDAEIAGARAAHLRDATAVCRFLHWLDEEAEMLAGDPGHGLTEIGVVTALEGFRRETGELRGISFETIAGAGEHGAITHYRVTENTDRAVRPGELLLVDSGGQYLDGTTDITRTIAIGTPPEDAAECYTRVLQGMIALSRARFPKGLAGRDLDALARFPLWTAGLDYDHGTGHGVGAYLSVHEGPQRISKGSETRIEPGMILSNEPGYYREGHFGIRIENLIVTREAPALPGADDREMYDFETLTYVPLERRLIVASMLSAVERDWIDAYHATTLDTITPHLDGAARDWLKAACAPL
ncbi:aminopeptidase P family protein [Limimaricola hongkongensis]|uniref:Xaa-Pro aminopeptidase n=1 Tax=Limimaricola hongkongensis DSM 17492 TaxID=1122180 RepID=A0A017HBS9_9RHOB|nr:aminopeptidase P family protein [Limimaricola hongkongensis]EYD71244.1 Xaa-Pro aminopeptidase [Limimaricola hongkongensis DSM 17492]